MTGVQGLHLDGSKGGGGTTACFIERVNEQLQCCSPCARDGVAKGLGHLNFCKCVQFSLQMVGAQEREVEERRNSREGTDKLNDCIYQHGLLKTIHWLSPNVKFYIWDSLVVTKNNNNNKAKTENGDITYCICQVYPSWHRSRTIFHNQSTFFLQWQWQWPQCVRT